MKHLEVEESDFVNFFEGILLNDQFLNVRELNDQFYLTNKQITLLRSGSERPFDQA